MVAGAAAAGASAGGGRAATNRRFWLMVLLGLGLLVAVGVWLPLRSRADGTGIGTDGGRNREELTGLIRRVPPWLRRKGSLEDGVDNDADEEESASEDGDGEEDEEEGDGEDEADAEALHLAPPPSEEVLERMPATTKNLPSFFPEAKSSAAKLRILKSLARVENGSAGSAGSGHSVNCAIIRRSTKYVPECFAGQTVRTLPLLVTGMGRSGTQFMATALRTLGFAVSHDNTVAGPDGAVSWIYAFAETKDIPYPSWAPSLGGLRFRHVFHQVRSPLQAISSRTSGTALFDRYVEQHSSVGPLPFVSRAMRKKKDKWPTFKLMLRRALMHYVSWNEFVERIAEYRYQVEQVSFADICQRAGFEQEPERRASGFTCPSESEALATLARANITTFTNHRPHKYVSWRILESIDPAMTARARALARRYGYPDTDDEE